MNYLVAGRFDAALEEAAQADAIGDEIGDPRLKTYAGFMAAWVEASRGNGDQALVASRRSRELAPDRVSHAFASMILGYALLQAGDHRGAREQLEPLVAEFESFGFPQWQGWASTLIAETYRLDGESEVAAAFVDRGLRVATQARYWYAVGFGERIAARIARDCGRPEASSRGFDRATEIFARIGARFEETRTRDDARVEVPVANGSSSTFGDRPSGL
jgi:tetratricopeptide (TPR) repeat protein